MIDKRIWLQSEVPILIGIFLINEMYETFSGGMAVITIFLQLKTRPKTGLNF